MDPTGRQAVRGSATIPVKQMALDSLEVMFPFLTAAQRAAMREGRPLPGPEAELPPQQPKPSVFPPAVAPAAAAPPALRPIAPAAPPDVSPAELLTALRGEVADLKQKLQTTLRVNAELTRIAEINEATITGQTSAPVVTAVMVISDPTRIRRARRAVNEFILQSYPAKQLVIVNASGQPVTDRVHRAIKELPWQGDNNPTTGAMRNFAADEADGEYVYPHWDDDDSYDPHLLAYMMAHRPAEPHRAIALTTQIRVDVDQSAAYLHIEPSGIPNTMIVPRRPSRPYPDETGGEDVRLWTRHWMYEAVVIDNGEFPVSALKMCLFDGMNVATREHFMADRPAAGHLNLAPQLKSRAIAVLTSYGFKIAPQASA